jgi:nucleoside-diphosphate-sugar epimerase
MLCWRQAHWPFEIVSKGGVSGQPINIGGEEETRIIDLAHEIIQISASKSQVEFRPFPPGHHHRRLPDGRKTKMILDWGPSIGLEAGLERTFRWLEAQKLC